MCEMRLDARLVFVGLATGAIVAMLMWGGVCRGLACDRSIEVEHDRGIRDSIGERAGPGDWEVLGEALARTDASQSARGGLGAGESFEVLGGREAVMSSEIPSWMRLVKRFAGITQEEFDVMAQPSDIRDRIERVWQETMYNLIDVINEREDLLRPVVARQDIRGEYELCASEEDVDAVRTANEDIRGVMVRVWRMDGPRGEHLWKVFRVYADSHPPIISNLRKELDMRGYLASYIRKEIADLGR